MNGDRDICEPHILRSFVPSRACCAVVLVAIMMAGGCMSEAVVPFDVHDVKTESAVLNLHFQLDRDAEKELGDCLMEYRIGAERFVAHPSEDGTVIALALPDESCSQVSVNTAGAYPVEVQPKEPDLFSSVILSHSIALSVDKIIVPLLLSDSGPRHEHATALAKELLKQDDLVVTGRLKCGSKFAGSLRLTAEGRWQLQNALGMSERK